MSAAPPVPPLHVPVPWWIAPMTKACIAGVALMLLGLVYGWWRRRHRPRVSKHDRSVRRWVKWVFKRWPWDAQNLGLVLVDDTTRHRRSWWSGKPLPVIIHIPPIRFQPAPNGLRAQMQTLPGVGLEQVSKAADHLANAWGCLRVDVAQDGPGRLALRGFRSDPLAQPWHITPQCQPLSGWVLHVGIDDEAETVLLPLSNLSGVTVAGVPGTGKTSLQRWWMCQLAPHPAVQIAVLDGKVSDPKDGDYGQFLARCFAAAGDDLGDANQLLCELWQAMRDRSAWLRTHRGTAQFWEHGPTADCPLVLVVVDESHTFVTGASRKDKELCGSNIWYLTKLAKEGRSRGFLTVFVTQKQTADAIPTAIRDVCQVGISFGVRTMDGAVAALGDDIRQYPDIAPTELIGRQWTGVAVMRLPDRTAFHRVRTPHVTEADAASLLTATAYLCQPPNGLVEMADDSKTEEAKR
jgi:DNA segregation ATPase FtsK/SpoIIIE, S-DNA-T family